MPHTYCQRTGEWFTDGVFVAKCYAGRGLGLNNPDMQDAHNVGPIPRGTYTICAPADHPHLGPFCMYLEPDPTNDMRGRSAFYFHADRVDSARKPFAASEGCIIGSRPVRGAIWASGDRILHVVGELQVGWPADAT
jgi:hypothetical protein